MDDIDRTGWTPEMIEEERLDNLMSPLFDMWLKFEHVFGCRGIDRYDISDEDAEKMAAMMEENGTESGRAFAHLLRGIPRARTMRVMCHRVEAVWLARGSRDPITFDEVAREYAKLGEGKA